MFQVLTQEDWNTVMYDAMRTTTQWAALYFIILMTLGNYILFNLLVAILVEGFSNDPVSCFQAHFSDFTIGKKYSRTSDNANRTQ